VGAARAAFVMQLLFIGAVFGTEVGRVRSHSHQGGSRTTRSGSRGGRRKGSSGCATRRHEAKTSAPRRAQTFVREAGEVGDSCVGSDAFTQKLRDVFGDLDFDDAASDEDSETERVQAWEDAHEQLDDPEKLIVEEDDESYTLKGAVLEDLLRQLEADGAADAFGRRSDSSDEEGTSASEDADASADEGTEEGSDSRAFHSWERESAPVSSPAFEAELGEEDEISEDPQYFDKVAAAAAPPETGEPRDSGMNYFEARNKEYMPSWLRDAYENGEEDLITGAAQGGFDKEAFMRGTPGRDGMEMGDTERMAVMPGSTLQEIADDFRVPVEFVVEELSAYGVKKPIHTTDILEHRALDDEVQRLSEVLHSFDAADLCDRYSDRDVKELAEHHSVELSEVLTLCELHEIYLCRDEHTRLTRTIEDHIVEQILLMTPTSG